MRLDSAAGRRRRLGGHRRVGHRRRAVGYRLLVLPDPAQFLSRQIGVYLAAAGAVGGILSGLALIATQRLTRRCGLGPARRIQ